MKALFPGTFDPPTLGHLNLIERSSKLFDEILVGVATHGQKTPLFTPHERRAFLERISSHCPNVRVEIYEGLTAEFAKRQEISILIRGVRSGIDLEYEKGLAIANKKQTNVETLFLLASSEHAHISSTIIRDIGWSRGDLSLFIPKAILQEVSLKLT